MRHTSPATFAWMSARVSGASGASGMSGGRWMPPILISTPEFARRGAVGVSGTAGAAGAVIFAATPSTSIFIDTPVVLRESAFPGVLFAVDASTALERLATSRSRSALIDFSASLAAFSRSFALRISSSNDLAVAVVSNPLSRNLSSASLRASSMVSRASIADSSALWATSRAAWCAESAASRAASRAVSAASVAAERIALPTSACLFDNSLRARSISLSARSSSAFVDGSLARCLRVPTMPSATLSALSPKARSISRLMARFSSGVAPLSDSRITLIGVVNNTSSTRVKKPKMATPHHGVL